jgi:acyl-coenzyme A synthetase/AMP-(fatty) acid ligase
VPSLGFELLDRHVVAGRADEIAWSGESATFTFAELLERTAALAGGLKALGVMRGDEVAVDVASDHLLVQLACACVRLGALPGDGGGVRVVEADDGVRVHHPEDVFELDVVLRAGRSDPAPSLASDPDGYRATVLQVWSFLEDLAR